ncbi:RHS repeat-associated core domain-containing protein [Roseateles sp. UC29_93]|uniref:RHS repeat-associated core domain-containing protein n=1 Tax=Roseateles sp. UC29_93 TaxID=3350177 RepID=UPI00366FF3C6
MNGIKRHLKCRSTLAPIVAAFIALIGLGAHAATLPPPPVSPAPVTDYEYDAKGNPTKVIKAKGVSGFGFTSSNTYDPLDRVKDSTDARNGMTRLGYDGLDQLKQVTDPRNLITSYQRNGLGDLNQLVSPDTGTANSTYDAVGNLLTRTDSRGVLATYTYDNLDRLKTAVYSKAGQASVSYGWTYDETGGDFTNGIGRLTTASFPGGSSKYAYDALGRVTTVTQAVSTVVSTTRYGYDGAGNITSITYPSGRVLTISYDRGQPTGLSLAKDASSAAKPLISQIQWEPFGPARAWLFHLNSTTKSYERVFDTYGRLVRYPLNGVVRDITYDAADRIVSYTHLDATTGAVTAEAQAMNQSFGYDELGRLTGIVTPANVWNIGYDANGNRTGVTLNGAARSYATETTSNRLTGIDNPTRSFGYDAAGNTLSDTGLGYTTTYGLDNRLASLTSAGVTTTYNYDAGGQRVRKVTGTSKPHYVYDQSGKLLGEYNSSGGALQEFVWLGDTLIAVLTNSTTTEPRVYYAYSDHLNTPRVIVNSAGDVRWRWIAEPFGTTAAETVPNSLENLVVNLRFPGQYFDKESGLSYNYFRDYDGTIGRYVQSDPIGLNGGINTYAYVGGNSIQYVDPSGLEVLVCARKARGMPGNHAYLWDTTTSTAAGRRAIFGMSIIPGKGDDEAGPSGDSCRPVEGSEGKEAKIMADMKTWGNWGLWTPYVDDCQNAVDRVLSANGLTSPGVPGGAI